MNKAKILLIEDDPFMTDILANEINNAGFELTLAKTGGEGIKKFQETSPDLIILDILLPDQNGFDTLKEIRKLPQGEGAKVIVLSNLAEGANLDEAKALQVSDYLVKSNYSLSEILERIKKVLGE